VPAVRHAEGDTVILEGRCPEHGPGAPHLVRTALSRVLVRRREPAPAEPAGAEGAGGGIASECPGSCGLCARHQQRTCTALIEVTERCDLGCPLCFAESSFAIGQPDPSLAQLKEMLQDLFAPKERSTCSCRGRAHSPRGPPRDHRGIALAGFTFVQVNTNGLRLASEKGYAEELRGAGLDSVFLQFDGLDDDTYRALRGRPLAAQKLEALERCAAAGLGVVLVPTVVPGVTIMSWARWCASRRVGRAWSEGCISNRSATSAGTQRAAGRA